MILTEAEIASLAEQTLARIDPPEGSALILEGSIAEGFGNSGSDIDFLLIADQETDLPTMPTLFFIDGRRVEIRTRSVGQIVGHLREVAAYAGRSARRIATLDEHLLNRCQRFLGAHVVHRPDLVEKVRDNLPRDDFAAIMTQWWGEYARQAVRHGVTQLALGETATAQVWVREGLQLAAKSWAARHGETYLEPKWLSLQLDRLAADPLVARYWSVLNGGDVRAGIRLVARLGVSGCADEPEKLTIERADGRSIVTTWQLGDRIHVVRERSDVFVLGETAGKVWRQVVWGRPVTAPVGAAADGGEIVGAFARYGLIRIAWKGQPITPRLPLSAASGPITPAPSAVRPVVGTSGATPTGPRAVDLSPVPAPRFAAAAMALMWANVMIENALEDLRGALDNGQWRVASYTAARVVNGGLRALLSAHGVSPLPSDAELLQRLDLVPAADPRIGVLAARLTGFEVEDEAGARRLLGLLGEYVGLVRAVFGDFPSSFDDAAGWQATLDIGYDWLRLGAYLDQQFPLDEAQDLLSSGGVQPHATTHAQEA